MLGTVPVSHQHGPAVVASCPEHAVPLQQVFTNHIRNLQQTWERWWWWWWVGRKRRGRGRRGKRGKRRRREGEWRWTHHMAACQK
jgi:hypothetical protein